MQIKFQLKSWPLCIALNYEMCGMHERCTNRKQCATDLFLRAAARSNGSYLARGSAWLNAKPTVAATSGPSCCSQLQLQNLILGVYDFPSNGLYRLLIICWTADLDKPLLLWAVHGLTRTSGLWASYCTSLYDHFTL